MKLTLRKTILLSSLLFVVLFICAVGIIFLNIDRKVTISGSFVYHSVYPVISEEEGFVQRIVAAENSEILRGDTIIVLQNKDMEMELSTTRNKMNILEMELEEILNMKKFDSNLSTLNITKLQEELSLKKDKLEFYKKIMNDKKSLFERKISSQNQYNEARLNYKTILSDIKSLEISIDEIDRNLKKLDTSSLLRYKLKQKDFENYEAKMRYLEKKISKLSIVAGQGGKMLADKMDNLLNTFVSRGQHLADVVSFESIDFIGYAKDADIIRISEGLDVYFNVELFRGKDFITGKVMKIGYKPVFREGVAFFPVEISVDKKEFFNRDRKYYLQAGVTGEAIVITEKNLPLARLIWERFVNYLDH